MAQLYKRKGGDVLVNTEIAGTQSAFDVAGRIPVRQDLQIDGTPGDDELVGTPQADVINGLGGNDSLDGLGGDDILDGGADDDSLLVSGTGTDTVHGGSGTDTLFIDYRDAVSPLSATLAAPNPGTDGFTGSIATLSADRIVQFDGVEQIQLLAGSANDVIHMGASRDDIRGGDGLDEIFTGEGDDYLDGGADNDWLRGEGGNDVVIGGLGDDLLEGGIGNDELIETEGGNDEMFGGDDDDMLVYSGALSDDVATALMDGGLGDDFFNYNAYGTGDAATLNGGEGNDVFIVTGGGDVAIDAGAGADYLELVELGTRYTVSLGSGSDLLALHAFDVEGPQIATVTVSDFSAGDGADALGLDQYLSIMLKGWDRTANPFASGHLALVQDGADAVVRIDLDGADDIYGPADLVVLQNVVASSLTARNLGGWAADGSGTAGQAITGTSADEILTGTSGDDLIRGLGGDDALHGASGDDRLEGGDDDDVLDGALGDDQLFGGAGHDRLLDPLGGSDQLFGEAGVDFITLDRQFTSGDSTLLLDGGADVDTLIYYGRIGGNDEVTLLGGTGDDHITAYRGGAVTIDAGDGADLIVIDIGAASYEITFGDGPAESDILALGNSFGPITSFNILDFTAGSGGDIIQLRAFLDSYAVDWNSATNPFETGFLLLGQRGADALILIDSDGGGDSFALLGTLENVSAAALNAVNVEFAPGTVAILGTDEADTLVGTAGDDDIRGLADNDTLDGGAGADRMNGGSGDDFYFVDNAGDRAIEAADGGFDRVFAAASFALEAGSEVEMLTTTDNFGTAAINLTGNELFQYIYGNAGANELDGGGGGDVMYGLGGDDRFTIRDASDRVVEFAGGGFDRVLAAASFTLEAGSEVEMFTTVANGATTAINLTGNALSQYMYGNAGANIIDGGGGGDVMYGFEGDDRFTIRNAADRVVEFASGGFDRVLAAASFTLEAGSQVEMFTTIDNLATTAINLTGNALFQYLYGNAGANEIDGGGGGDVMYGFGGDDRFYTRDAADRVVEAAGGGFDRVLAGASFTLEAGSEVEMFTTADNLATTAINLTGNALSQYMYGNAGVNIIDGGGGGDVMYGFEGDDFFVIRNASDRVVEFAGGGGSDRVFAAASFTLEAGSEVEMFTTADNLATTAINLTGNAIVQYLYGNAGANVLDGKGGADVLTGFGGADSFAFTSALGGGNIDRIGDFSSADDTIRLDDAVFAGLALGALNPNAFVIGTQAGDTDDRIIYNQATGALLFDADGSGGVAAVQFATVDGIPFIAANDFLVI